MAIQPKHTPRVSQPSPGPAARLAAFVPGRRTKWLILVAWLVVVAVVSPFAGKLAEVEENDAVAWLPGNAE